MTAVIHIGQLLLAIVETWICYGYCDLVFGIQTQTKRDQALKAFVVAVLSLLLFTNRITAIFINCLLYLFQSAFVALSGYWIYKIKYSTVLSVTLPYYSLTGLFHILYCFMILLILKDDRFIKEVYYGSGLWCFIVLILTIVSMICVYRAIKRWIKSTYHFVLYMKWQLLIFGFLCWWIVPWGQVQLLKLGYEWVIWSLGTLVFTSTMIIAVCVLLAKRLKEETELKLINQKEQMMNSFYNEIKFMYENSLYTAHDMKSHILILRSYAENKDTEKVLTYLEKISTPIDAMNQYIWCENEIVNLIVNTKLQEAKKKKILVVTEVEDIAFQMADHDLCSVLSNLLENAVEACEKVEPGSRWIRICMADRHGYFIIKIENSLAQQPKVKNGVYLTNKTGSHGYGLKSVQSVVNKYHGAMKCTHNDETFSVVITFTKKGREE